MSAAPMERGATRPVSFLQRHQYDGNQRPDKERKQVLQVTSIHLIENGDASIFGKSDHYHALRAK